MPQLKVIPTFVSPAWPVWYSPTSSPTLRWRFGAARQGRGLCHGPAQSPRAPKTAPHGSKATMAIWHQKHMYIQCVCRVCVSCVRFISCMLMLAAASWPWTQYRPLLSPRFPLEVWQRCAEDLCPQVTSAPSLIGWPPSACPCTPQRWQRQESTPWAEWPC